MVNCGYKCLLQSILNFNSPTEVNQYVKYEGIKVIIGIHAFRAGKLLEGKPGRYVVIWSDCAIIVCRPCSHIKELHDK